MKLVFLTSYDHRIAPLRDALYTMLDMRPMYWPTSLWVGIEGASGELLSCAAVDDFGGQRVIQDLYADPSRQGKLALFKLISFLHDTTPKGHEICFTCALHNRGIQRIVEKRFGFKPVGYVYRKEVA